MERGFPTTSWHDKQFGDKLRIWDPNPFPHPAFEDICVRCVLSWISNWDELRVNFKVSEHQFWTPVQLPSLNFVLEQDIVAMLPRTKFSHDAICRISQFLRRDMNNHDSWYSWTASNSTKPHGLLMGSKRLCFSYRLVQTANRAPVECPKGFRASLVATCPLKTGCHARLRYHPARPNGLCLHLPNKLLTMSFQTCAGVFTYVPGIDILLGSLTRYKAFCLLSIWRFFCLECQNLYPATNAWSCNCNFCADL